MRAGPSRLFVRKFLIAVIDVTDCLLNGWAPLPTVAHALALRVLLNKTEELVDLFTVEMPPGWREVPEENLYDGLDIEPLYAPDGDHSTDRHHLKTGVAMDSDSQFAASETVSADQQ